MFSFSGGEEREPGPSVFGVAGYIGVVAFWLG